MSAFCCKANFRTDNFPSAHFFPAKLAHVAVGAWTLSVAFFYRMEIGADADLNQRVRSADASSQMSR